MDKLLLLLENNPTMPIETLAASVGLSVQEAKEIIRRCEKSGVIKGYRALIDWDKTERHLVTARIEVKITLDANTGFDEVCDTLAEYDEVESVYLMSGSYDVALTVSGKTFREVAMFVASRLSTLSYVQSTSTSFVLKKYKERGLKSQPDIDEREVRM